MHEMMASTHCASVDVSVCGVGQKVHVKGWSPLLHHTLVVFGGQRSARTLWCVVRFKLDQELDRNRVL